jgi:hypothetical protein
MKGNANLCDFIYFLLNTNFLLPIFILFFREIIHFYSQFFFFGRLVVFIFKRHMYASYPGTVEKTKP